MKSLFSHKGSLIELLPTDRFPLHDPQAIFLIESGKVDLFFLEAKNFAPGFNMEALNQIIRNAQPLPPTVIEGALHYLATFISSELLFPFPLIEKANGYIIAMFFEQVLLRRLEINELIKQPTEEESTHFIKNFNHWVIKFSEEFSSKNIMEPDIYLNADQTYSLAPNQTAMFPNETLGKGHQDLIWVETRQGIIEIVNQIVISLTTQQAPFPLAPQVLLHSVESAQLTTYEKLDWGQPNFWIGITLFNRLVFQALFKKLAKKSLQEQMNLAIQIEYDRQVLQNTFKDMQSLLEEERPKVIDPMQPSIVKACQIIGKELNQPFAEIHESLPSHAEGMANLIALRSLVACRKVSLDKRWWKQDSGPLLGIYKKENKNSFVALIPSRPQGYSMVEPGHDQKIRMDDRLMASLSTTAFMFYRHFPLVQKLSFWKVMQFGIERVHKDLFTGIAAASLAVICTFLIPIASAVVFDQVIPSSDPFFLGQILLGLTALSLASSLFTTSREVSLLRLECYATHDIECALWQRILNLPLKFFRKYSSGDLLQRLDGINEIRRLLSNHALQVGINTLFSLFNLAIMAYFSPSLTIVAMGLMALLSIFFSIGFMGKQRIVSLKTEASAEAYEENIQTITGISKIRTFAAENRFFGKWEQIYLRMKRLEIQEGRIGLMLRLITELIPYLIYLCIFSALYFMNKEKLEAFTFGSYIAFTSAFMGLYLSFQAFQKSFFEIIACIPLWKRSKPILDEIPESDEPKIILENLTGEMRAEQISFRYSEDGPLILEDVSLQAAPGEFIAIVGHSGSGKSTLLRLLLGFEQPEKGAIYFNGKDLKDLDIKAVRSQIGVVLQNSAILQGTVRENISGGRLASEDEVMQAVKLAALDGDLESMPMGLNTPLTGSLGISGGQGQRIILARALIGNPKLLILDEATNALDNKTQEVVSRNLDNCHVTRIVIAHRLSTIIHAHCIYVMHKGKIIQKGNYQELMQQGGLFMEFVERQRI